ncbi:hypothetical protein NIES4072_70120 [Nostoc commune NIES-4072]|uniref:Uncharacterized protein n=1 Tax=Nostoc commune NIES-4072 TaxID=2005467 RepID=A0A2R5FX57_NOSCO|nr:hypothetical protein [Nostoc commune]BBD70645.1 hypothetical protein NIES4070_70560 [Nostoc commune HK-02]GBG23300.1 hypothetical protein NIES4072_70120 [Nostoc commune NIES-4072]
MSNKVYFGFAVADSMFPAEATIKKQPFDATANKKEIESAASCCNGTHKATVEAANSRFGLNIQIPAKPPSISLGVGDSIIVMGVRNLPRLEDNRHYTDEEINSASFVFSKYTIVE